MKGRWPWLVVAALAVAQALFARRPVWDGDVFWHLELGRWMVEHGAFIRQDVFSALHPERPTASLQWLYEVAMHGLDAQGGLSAVRWFHVLVQLVTVPALYFVFARKLRLPPTVALVLICAFVLLFADRLRLRPHVVNPLFWAAFLPVFARGPAALRPRDAAFAFALTFLWSCVHAGVGGLIFVVAALAVPLSALVARAAQPGAPPPLKGPALWFLGVVAGACLAPEALVGNWLHLVRFGSSEAAASEWAPTWSMVLEQPHPGRVVAGLLPTVALVLVGARALGLARDRREGRALDPAALCRVFLAVALLYLAHSYARFAYLGAFAGALAAVGALPLSARARAAGLAAAAVLFGLAAHLNTLESYGDWRSWQVRLQQSDPVLPGKYPKAQAAFLERTGFEGRVYAQPDWGGYLLYRLFPKVRVVSDGRAAHGPEVTRDLLITSDPRNFADPSTGPALAEIYARYPVEAIVHQHPVWPPGYAPPASFVRVFQDRFGAIWIRADTEAGRAYLERLRASP